MLIQYVLASHHFKRKCRLNFQFSSSRVVLPENECCNDRPECLILMMVFSVLLLNFLMMSNLDWEGIAVFWVLLLSWLMLGGGVGQSMWSRCLLASAASIWESIQDAEECDAHLRAQLTVFGTVVSYNRRSSPEVETWKLEIWSFLAALRQTSSFPWTCGDDVSSVSSLHVTGLDLGMNTDNWFAQSIWAFSLAWYPGWSGNANRNRNLLLVPVVNLLTDRKIYCWGMKLFSPPCQCPCATCGQGCFSASQSTQGKLE